MQLRKRQLDVLIWCKAGFTNNMKGGSCDWSNVTRFAGEGRQLCCCHTDNVLIELNIVTWSQRGSGAAIVEYCSIVDFWLGALVVYKSVEHKYKQITVHSRILMIFCYIVFHLTMSLKNHNVWEIGQLVKVSSLNFHRELSLHFCTFADRTLTLCSRASSRFILKFVQGTQPTIE